MKDNKSILDYLELLSKTEGSGNPVTVTKDTHEKRPFYCVTVPGTAFYIKSKGKVSVTGNCHVEGLNMLFKLLVEDENFDIQKIEDRIYSLSNQAVDLEDKFIDLAYELGAIKGLAVEDIKKYVKYILDRRLKALGLKTLFKTRKNPLPWMDDILSSRTHSNFFESRVTDYSVNGLSGEWVY